MRWDDSISNEVFNGTEALVNSQYTSWGTKRYDELSMAATL